MIGRYIRIAFANLWMRKVKALLTMLGIVIGVAAVIIIFAVSEGAQYLVLDQVNSMGTNLLGVLPGKSEEDGPPASAQGIVITTLTYKDAQDIGDPSNAQFISAVAPYVKGVGPVSYRGEVVDTTYTGTSHELPEVEELMLTQGRFFNELEVRSYQNVAVLGSKVYEELYAPGASVLGTYLSIKGESFQVVGVVADRGVVFFQNQDDQIYIPVTTAQKKLLGINHLGLLRAKVDDPVYMERSIADVERVLRKNHRIKDPADDDFSVRSSVQAIETLTTITDSLQLFLAFVAGISLLVGGIGIMNIMLMTVGERTKEIGLRKAIGAPRRTILFQFLVESVVLCSIGGAVGVFIGVLFSYIIAAVITAFALSWVFVIPLESIVLAVGVTFAVGVLFGYYPARKAAFLDPIIALRTE